MRATGFPHSFNDATLGKAMKIMRLAAAALSASLLLAPMLVNAQLKIMAVGDSITEGFGSDGGTKSYRFFFEDLLARDSCNYEMVGSRFNNLPATSYISAHEAISGISAFSVLEGVGGSPGITSMMTQSPDVVLLHLGSNDINGGTSPAITKNHLEDILDKICLLYTSPSPRDS